MALANFVLQAHSQGICPTPESSESSSVGNLGVAPQDRDLSFESLKHILSSDSGRGSLYALPIEEAVTVIDALEQVNTKAPYVITD